MKKKYLYPSIIGSVLVAVIFIYSVNVMAYGEDKKAERTYQSDRTLIKEVIANQRKTHALLNEIKASLQAPR